MPYNRWIEGLPMNIYKLTNPINNQVFYVGRTQRKLSYRILGHLSAGRGNQRGVINKRHSELIGAILKSAQSPIIELVDWIPEINTEDDFSFACYLEKFWILKHLELGYSLTNRPPSYTMKEIKFHIKEVKNKIMAEEKRKRGRPPGSGKKKEAEIKPYKMTPELSDAIDNAVAEMPKPPKIEGATYPSNWNDMGKVQKLEWLTANPRK